MTATTLRRRAWPLYLGVFTTSVSVLLLEIALTRIFSVSLWYHLAFMVISTALLGFGTSGTLLAGRDAGSVLRLRAGDGRGGGGLRAGLAGRVHPAGMSVV